MLVAIAKSGERKPAFRTERVEGPFTCPYCGDNVIIKKGTIMAHHFAHRPKSVCPYSSGETLLHYETKKGLFEALEAAVPAYMTCELEKLLGPVRPDIFLADPFQQTAIEVQCSSITPEEITRRTLCYYDLGVSVLWLVPGLDESRFPLVDHYRGDNTLVGRPDHGRYKIRAWEKFIQALYYGRLYTWFNGPYVEAVHISKWKRVYRREEKLHLIEDFEYRQRDGVKLFGMPPLPSCEIWIDKGRSWWPKDEPHRHSRPLW